MRKRILELNASDDRGINQVREKVKNYASVICIKNPDKTYKCPPFKIVVLDEADNMTRDAQQALRRIIEDNAVNTRFCIICNYITKIIEPLSSRCIKFRFNEIPVEQQTESLRTICNSEKVLFENDALLRLVTISKGDLRRSTNLLQTLAKVNGSVTSVREVDEIAGVVPDGVVESVIAVITDSGFEELIRTLDNIMDMGYSAVQIITRLYSVIVSNTNITQLQKARIITKIAESEGILLEGSRDNLTLYSLFSSIKIILSS